MTFESIPEWQAFRRSEVFTGKSVGFVPTMGALHEGHRSLLARARKENDLVVASIFVNPTQFDDPKDLKNYPRTWEEDLAVLGSEGVDFTLLPSARTLYADSYRYRITERELSRELCGSYRPGHFEGVLTVVMKLLNLVQATRAYFGEKDYQQLILVRGMCDAFFLPTEIIACPTIRENSGLALSSRNKRLDEKTQSLASVLPRVLRESEDALGARQVLAERGFEVDYVEDRWDRRLAAVRLEGVRLIDNVELEFK